MKSNENLKAIRFAGELLPKWAQLLDVATRLCLVPESVCHWFSRLVSGAGVEDARTVIDHCTSLRANLQTYREFMLVELRRSHPDFQPTQILAAWTYSLDTMILAAQSAKTCTWFVEGIDDLTIDDSDGDDITLRRV